MTKTVQREVRKRGLMGKIFKWLFILFNIFMAWAFIQGLIGLGEAPEPTTDAGKTGHTVGAAIGILMLLAIWGFGDIILGMLTLFTRGKPVLITEEEE